MMLFLDLGVYFTSHGVQNISRVIFGEDQLRDIIFIGTSGTKPLSIHIKSHEGELFSIIPFDVSLDDVKSYRYPAGL